MAHTAMAHTTMAHLDHIHEQAQRAPERVAARDLASGRSWSYSQLDADVSRCARVLRERACDEGERVVAIAHNHVALMILHWACARIGAIYAPFNTRLSQREWETLLAKTSPRLLVIDERVVCSLRADLSLAALLDAVDHATPTHNVRIEPERPSLLLFTSGTTGTPKGALLTEANLAATARNFSALGRVTNDSVFLCDAPMFHVIGLVANTRAALMQGGTCLVSEGFEPMRTLSRLADRALSVTHYFCVPQMAAALRSAATYEPQELRGLRAIFTGGAPIDVNAQDAFAREQILLVNGYGMTEVGTVFGMPLDAGVSAAKPRSVGVAPPSVQTRVVDEQDRDCSAGTPGELLVRGDNVFLGYFDEPEETRRAFVDGWFRTGDIVRIDSDGYCTLVDRKKDMFISGGENVYPAEIEACLVGFPGVEAAAVVGVPDSVWGEVGHLALVTSAASVGVAPDPQRVKEFLYTQLARYKVPKYVSVLDQLPRTGSGKVSKKQLRDRLLEDSAEARGGHAIKGT